MILRRDFYQWNGIFGALLTDDKEHIAFTLEHAFPSENGGFAPAVPPGRYLCMRGVHQLVDAPPFETFEVMGVPGHSGILFHRGNFNNDSLGCILLGESIYDGSSLTQSAVAFEEFMGDLEGVNSFGLEVI